jgi:methionine-rich copper-binding protein CopC
MHMGTTCRPFRMLIAALLSTGLLLFVGGLASAHSLHPSSPTHAKVIDALPKMGSTIIQPPTTVTVFTAENMAPGPTKSNLFVYGPTGELISQGDATVSLNNPKEMSISIKPSSNPKDAVGGYIVRWITVSADDGDSDQGAYSFTVNPGATAASKATTPPSTTTAGMGGTAVWVPIVVGILALLIGLGGGFGLGRGRRRAASSVGGMRRTIAEQQEEAPPRRP